jgi:hypothetical protein
MFRRANGGDTSITAAQIANKIHVTERRISISREKVHVWFDELKAMKFSPRLADIICLDGCPSFGLWFDTRQDSVHYSVLYTPIIPDQHSTQQLIAEWMLKVRTEIDAIQKAK